MRDVLTNLKPNLKDSVSLFLLDCEARRLKPATGQPGRPEQAMHQNGIRQDRIAADREERAKKNQHQQQHSHPPRVAPDRQEDDDRDGQAQDCDQRRGEN